MFRNTPKYSNHSSFKQQQKLNTLSPISIERIQQSVQLLQYALKQIQQTNLSKEYFQCQYVQNRYKLIKILQIAINYSYSLDRQQKQSLKKCYLLIQQRKKTFEQLEQSIYQSQKKYRKLNDIFINLKQKVQQKQNALYRNRSKTEFVNFFHQPCYHYPMSPYPIYPHRVYYPEPYVPTNFQYMKNSLFVRSPKKENQNTQTSLKLMLIKQEIINQQIPNLKKQSGKKDSLHLNNNKNVQWNQQEKYINFDQINLQKSHLNQKKKQLNKNLSQKYQSCQLIQKPQLDKTIYGGVQSKIRIFKKESQKKQNHKRQSNISQSSINIDCQDLLRLSDQGHKNLKKSINNSNNQDEIDDAKSQCRLDRSLVLTRKKQKLLKDQETQSNKVFGQIYHIMQSKNCTKTKDIDNNNVMENNQQFLNSHMNEISHIKGISNPIYQNRKRQIRNQNPIKAFKTQVKKKINKKQEIKDNHDELKLLRQR